MNCLIAQFAALSDQERGASKQLAPPLPLTQSKSALVFREKLNRNSTLPLRLPAAVSLSSAAETISKHKAVEKK
jgi:hypothetical protein